jgi:hypothetical protein
MTATDIAVLASVVVAANGLKDVGVYLIQRGLGRNGSNGHCADHGEVCSILKRLSSNEEENSLAQTVERAVRRGMVRGTDIRD